MSRIKYLREEIPGKEKELKELREKLEKEKRARTTEEREQFDALIAEIKELRDEMKELEDEERQAQQRAGHQGQTEEQRRAAMAAGGPSDQGEGSEKRKVISKYSFLRTIRNAVDRAEGKAIPFDGVEREMHEEAEKEARESQVDKGITGVGVPSWFMKPATRAEKRAISVGSATSAGNLVETSLEGFIPALRPTLMTQELGAMVMTGLNGNIDMPRETNLANLTWEGETDENAEDTATTDKIQLRPNRGGVTTPISKQLIIQSSIDVETWIRRRFEFAVAKGIDLAAINGSGSSNQPKGILNFSGLGTVSLGDDGAAPTYGKIIELIKTISVENALVGSLAFLGNPDVKAKLQTTPLQSSGIEGNFIMSARDGENLLGYRFGNSTQVPNDLTKGAGTDLSALIFGNWADLIIANWAGLDIVVDPYSLKKNAQIEITINSWWDVDAEHEESFAAIQDMITTLN